MRKFLLIAAVVTVSACATPRERIADSLIGYGLDEARADCVGSELQRNLSLGQLQELGRAARAFKERDPNPTRLTIDDLLRVASQVRDPRVPIEVAKAAGRCRLTPLGFAPAKLEMDAA